jgi:hypothetical protein
MVLPASSGASPGPPFQTGLYVGKTSQGLPIRFRVRETSCDAPTRPFRFRRAYCFIGVVANARLNGYYPTMIEPYRGGAPPYKDPLYAASYQLSLSGSGRLTWLVRGLGSTLTTDGSLTSLKLQVKRGMATGTLRQTESYDSGGGTQYCDSGTVHFTARRLHA